MIGLALNFHTEKTQLIVNGGLKQILMDTAPTPFSTMPSKPERSLGNHVKYAEIRAPMAITKITQSH